RAFENNAGVDVHVVDHVLEHRGVDGDFDAGGGFATEDAAAAGGEDQDIGAAGDDASHANRIVAGGVHDHKAFGFHGLGITDDVDQGGTASLGDGAQGFFVDGSQAAFLVAGGGIVIDLGPKDTGVPLPPFDALDKLFAHLAAYGPAREQMLGPINLRS